MELIHNLGIGFETALSLQNVFYCFVGVLLGTAIGVLPGLGPLPTIAMLLPITYGLEPASALIMLAGIYYGAQYGGSTTAILVNLPGESSSVVTCIDGYQMAKRGRAGAAIAIAAIGSFFAGTVATLIIATVAPALASFAFMFGAAEYFSLMVLGIVFAVSLAHGSMHKALAMVVLGLILGLVGTDVNTGFARFTFGVIELRDGLEFVAIAMGVFAFAEIVSNLAAPRQETVTTSQVGKLWPSGEEMRQAAPAILRGTAIGSVLGVLPGGGALLSAFAAYSVEKRIAKNPERFGGGAVEGVAGPESANNAGAQTSFIPMLTLGIPSNGVMALMVGAMMIHNIQPGPRVMITNPDLFWGLIVSMWIGNVMLVLLNLPLVGLWVRLLSVRYEILFPCIVVFCCIGAYSIDNTTFDIYIAGIFALVGYVFVKLRCEPAPLLLGVILGPLMEENFRRALLLSNGDAMTFVTSPLSLALLLAALAVIAMMLVPSIAKSREEIFTESS